MSSIPAPSFYVYVLCRPNGKPFYVGKGKGRRIYDHEREASNGHQCHKCNVIRKIWKQGETVQRYTVFTTDDEQEAFDYECELIALYGRENLTNQTDGGDGPSGAIYSPETCAKRSRGIKAAWTTTAYRTKQHEAALARYTRPEERAKARAINKALWADPVKRAKLSSYQKTVYADPEARAKISASQKQSYIDNPERGAKVSAANTQRWSDPEKRAKQSAKTKAIWAQRKAEHEAEE